MPTKKPSKSKEAEKPKLRCEFCKKDFVVERKLVEHVCEQKRRFLRRDDRPNKLGFMIFRRWWRQNYRSKRDRTYEEFAKSTLFKAFVSFGKYMDDINALRPEEFIDFIFKAEVPLAKWESPLVYERYVRELTKKETPLAAVERNFLLMQQWSMDSGEDWTDFFRKVPTTLATQWIISGRISPWVLYIAPSAQDLMSRMTEEQIEMIQRTIEPKFWSIKLKVNAKDVEIIREQLEAAGL